MLEVVRVISHFRYIQMVSIAMSLFTDEKDDERVNSIRRKALAVFVGTALFFILPITIGSLLGDNTPLYLPLLVAPYGMSGAFLGFLWPDVGWRLGLWLSAIWPPMLLFMLFLGGDALMKEHVDLKGTVRDLLGYLMIMIAACLGAEVGAIIRRRRRADSST